MMALYIFALRRDCSFIIAEGGGGGGLRGLVFREGGGGGQISKSVESGGYIFCGV